MMPLCFSTTLFVVFISAAVFVMEVTRMRRVAELQKYVEDHRKIYVSKSFKVEYMQDTEKLFRGAEFQIIRRSGDCVICQDCVTGKMLFVRQNKLLEGLAQGRLEWR